MFKYLNKRISAPIAIIIILCIALIAGIIIWQYLETPEEEIIKRELEFPSKTNLSFEDKQAWYEILKWPEDCNSLEYKDFDQSLIFYELGSKKYLVSIICEMFAYQGEYAFMFFDENTSPPTSKLLYFKTYDIIKESIVEGSWSIVGDISFYEEEKELIVYRKGRGIGDCGEYIVYQIKDDGTSILKEYRAQECGLEEFIYLDKWKIYYQEKISE